MPQDVGEARAEGEVSIQHEDPRWQGEIALFSDHYERIVFHACNLRGDNPPEVRIGSRDDRRCTLCEKRKGETSFSKVSHVIPAGVGNRHIFSFEECDKCNKDYGDAHDDHLSKMLLPQRAIGRVRGRKGTAKLRAPDSKSHIGGGQFDGHLPVLIDIDELIDREKTSIELKVSDESNTATISMHAPPYRPVDAIKSILRSIWLSLSEPDRAVHAFVRDFILGGTLASPVEYFTFFVPHGYSATILECWRKKSESQIETAPLIVRLICANTAIVWCAPSISIGAHIPSLLPPFEGLSEATRPSGNLHIIENPTVLREPKRAVYTLTFQERRRRSPGQVDEPSPSSPSLHAQKKRPQTLMRLELETPSDGTLVVANALATIQRFDTKAARLLFEGGSFAGSLIVHADHASGRNEVYAEPKPYLTSARDALATLRFILALRRFGGTLKIISEVTEGLLMRASVFPETQTVEDPPVAELLEWLVVVNGEFGTDIRIPATPEDIPTGDAEVLAVAIKSGAAELALSEPIQMTLPRMLLPSVLADINAGKDFAGSSELLFEVLGHALRPGMVRTIFIKPKLAAESEEVLKSSTEPAGPEDCVTLMLRCERLVYEFERWMNRQMQAVPT